MSINLAILCGGRSGEHEVSLQSARSIYHAVELQHFSPMLVAIDKQGRWRMGSSSALLSDAQNAASIHINPQAPEVLPLTEEGHCRLQSRESGQVLWEVEAFFPIIHGTDGEDGALQGLLRLLDVPFVGSGVLGSAVAMDKEFSKRLLHHAGLPVARWEVLDSLAQAPEHYERLSAKWGLPLFVKPTCLGSSVGVSRVKTWEQFRVAVELALSYDLRALVEEGISGRELECSVLGNRHGPGTAKTVLPQASRVGEILPSHDFYSYEAKYLDPEGARLILPAELEPELEDRARALAIEAFTVLQCDGLARVDFFLKDKTLLVNEVNTLPGFTKISMYPKLWELSGLPFPQLITRLVELGLERHAQSRGLKRDYVF